MPKRRPQEAKAIISGQAGIVIFVDGREACTFRRINEENISDCRRQDIPYLLGDCSDSIVVTGKSPIQAYRILENEWKNDRAIQLLLILIDGSSHLRAKRIAVGSLEEMLASATVYQFVAHRLYARPLPKDADLDEALRMSNEQARKQLWGLLTDIRTHQDMITNVRNRWELLDVGLFENDYQGKNEFEQAVIEEGLFFILCTTQVTAEQPNIWSQNHRLRHFRLRKDVLTTWVSPFLTQKKDVMKETQGSFDELWGTNAH